MTRAEDKMAPGAEIEVPESRALTIVGLKMAGASFTSIAQQIGLPNATAARQIYETAIAATVDESKDLPHLRSLTHARLERLLASVWNQANSPKNPDQIAYSRQALALIDRMIRLHGMDAAQRLEVFTPDQEAKERYLAEMIDRVGFQNIPREADIIDAEIIDSDIEPEDA